MKCPFCQGSSHVVDTREVAVSIRRRRECDACGQRFTTYERIAATNLQIIKSDGRRSYLRCSLTQTDGRWIAHLTRMQSSGALYSLVEADGLLIVPEDVKDVAAGTSVEVRLLR